MLATAVCWAVSVTSMSEPATPQLRSVTNAVSGIEVDIVADPADMYLQSQLAAPDNFEPVVSVAQRILAPDAVVLDVGACLGFVSAAMSQVVPEGRVVAVEAGPHLIEGLRATAARARGASVDVVHAAVGATSGEIEYHADANGGAWGYVTPAGTGLRAPATANVVTVAQRTIDDIVADCGLDRVDLMKLDVEGFEVRALEGAQATLDRSSPVVVAELNPFCLWRYGRTLPQDLIDVMRARFAYLHAVAPDGSVTSLDNESAISALLGTIGVTGGLVDLVGSTTPVDLPDRFDVASRVVDGDVAPVSQRVSIMSRVLRRRR